MRISSNAFIVATVAVLSLVTPVVNADSVKITSPKAGQQISILTSINVVWTVLDSTGLNGVDCDIALLEVGTDPNIPPSPGILQTGVPVLNGHSDGPITIPDVTGGTDYFLALISADQTTTFGKSDEFTIV